MGFFQNIYIYHETQNTQEKFQIHMCANIETKSKDK